MGDYNPKTSYQFRWSDSKKIQKFIQGQIIVHDVSFDVPTSQESIITYNFDTVPEAKTIAETIKYCYDNEIPLIIFDINGCTWISTDFGSDTECHISRTINNKILTTFIDVYDDYIEINPVVETLLSADNVKTLFGTQSIVGQGNIDLYTHQILVNNDCYFNIPSSNNLPIDSPQDLTTVLKPTTKNIYYFGVQKTTLLTASLEYDKATNLWKYRTSNSELTAVTTVKDVHVTI